jgi:hypothetical protein
MKQRDLFKGAVVKDRQKIHFYLARLMRILAGTPPKGEGK